MRTLGCLITCAALLSACGGSDEPISLAPLDLEPCAGWVGPVPSNEGQFARAALAERTGRLCANSKLKAVAELRASGA